MTFDHLIGHSHIKEALDALIAKQRVGNSLLFAGPDGVGKFSFAKAFAKRLLGTSAEAHPDLHILRPHGKLCLHSIDAIREFIHEVSLPPYQAPYKVFIIEDAHAMLPTSSNALLKTFEEPTPETVIILVSDQIENLLETILSRCRILRFHLLNPLDIEKHLQKSFSIEQAHTAAAQSRGSYARAVAYLSGKENTLQTELFTLLRQWPFASYSQVQGGAQSLSLLLENEQKLLENTLHKEMMQGAPQEMSAAYKENFTKEMQGALSSQFFQVVNGMFEEVVFWFRDLYLLRLDGNSQQLLHPLEVNVLKSQIEKEGATPDLERVHRVIESCLLALRRSTKLSHILENLFLELFLLKNK